jgi:hypothetical protein
MPEPKLNGLTFKKEKIWSKNTGRGCDGTMLGDIIGIKTTASIQWPPLSDADVAKIDNAISRAFATVTYKDPSSGSMRSGTFYFGTPTYPVYSYHNGVRTYSGVTVDMIEQ